MNTLAKNIIYYGVPGTGKTHKLQQLMHNYCEQLPQADILGQTLSQLNWKDVLCLILLEQQTALKVTDLAQHHFVTKKNNGKNANISATLINELNRFACVDSHTGKRDTSNVSAHTLFTKDDDGFWQLLSTDEPHIIHLQSVLHKLTQAQQMAMQTPTIKRYAFVSFHQNYGYEEFIEGLRPVVDATSKQISYQVQQGAFLKLCEHARHNPSERYALFIDEINRANVSKVFGELLTLLEPNKRAGMPEQTSVVLAYSGVNFSVPANVDVYATMNTADRSLTPLDSAMRRRFDFVEIAPQPNLLANDVDGVNVQKLLTALNLRISALLGNDYVLGHASFMKIRSLVELNQCMQQKIIPLLQDYCFNDLQQVQTILADDNKDEASKFITYNQQAQLLGLDTHTNLMVNPNIHAFHAQSYTPIYEGL